MDNVPIFTPAFFDQLGPDNEFINDYFDMIADSYTEAIKERREHILEAEAELAMAERMAQRPDTTELSLERLRAMRERATSRIAEYRLDVQRMEDLTMKLRLRRGTPGELFDAMCAFYERTLGGVIKKVPESEDAAAVKRLIKKAHREFKARRVTTASHEALSRLGLIMNQAQTSVN